MKTGGWVSIGAKVPGDQPNFVFPELLDNFWSGFLAIIFTIVGTRWLDSRSVGIHGRQLFVVILGGIFATPQSG